jgi:hypothetical protein
MLLWGIAVGQLVAFASGRAAMLGDGDVRWKKTNALITKAAAHTSKATMRATLGEREKIIGRLPDAGFDLLPRLSFSGTCGLPRFSL